MARQRYLKPVEVARALQLVYRELGYHTAAEQTDVTVSVLREIFGRGGADNDRLVASTMRVLGCDESLIWELAKVWSEELGRDAGEVWQNVWMPDFDKEEEDKRI